MRFSRTHLVAALSIVAGGALGASLSFGLLGSRSDDAVVVPSMSPEARADAIDRAAERILRMRIEEFGVQEPLEFKLLLPVAELESALSRIDRQIVLALGSDSVRALGRDVENLLFHNLRPFTSLLRSGDVEGAYLVATEDVELTTLFLGLTEVQRALPTDVSLHWEAGLVDGGRSTYRRLYVTVREAFATGEIPDDVPTTQAGGLIAVVRDGEVIRTLLIG